MVSWFQAFALNSTWCRYAAKQNEQLMHFIYEAKAAGGSVLAPAMIKEMLSIEQTFFTDKKFATFCVADIANVSRCSPAGTYLQSYTL